MTKLSLYQLLAIGLLGAMTYQCCAASRDSLPARYEGFTQPVQQIEVAASQSGRVSQVIVRRGDIVQENDVLMQLDTKVLEAAKAVAQAKADSTAQVDAAEVDLEIKQNRLEKLTKLKASGAGSPEEVKRAQADAKISQLEVDKAVENRRLTQLELNEIQARIEQLMVRSPIAGVVTDVIKEPGEYVSLSEPHVVTIVRLDQLRATFYVPTALAMQISVTAPIDLLLETPVAHAGVANNSVEAVAAQSSKTQVAATVEHIGAVTQADSGRVRLDVLIDNAERDLRSGLRCSLLVR